MKQSKAMESLKAAFPGQAKRTTLMDTECTRSRTITIAQVQGLFNREGGYREKRAPVASLSREDGATNTIDAFDADGEHLGCVAWRPDREGLFICG